MSISDSIENFQEYGNDPKNGYMNRPDYIGDLIA